MPLSCITFVTYFGTITPGRGRVSAGVPGPTGDSAFEPSSEAPTAARVWVRVKLAFVNKKGQTWLHCVRRKHSWLSTDVDQMLNTAGGGARSAHPSIASSAACAWVREYGRVYTNGRGIAAAVDIMIQHAIVPPAALA